MPSINQSGSGGTLREAIAIALGHRVIVEGGTATAVIDLSNPHPRKRKRPPRPRPGRPRLTGRATEDGRKLVVWCPYCGEHAHGRHGADADCGEDCPCILHIKYTNRGRCTCPVGSGDGHRGAHCVRDTPFTATGYWIVEARP
jgi:hypothetical protein